MYLEPSDARALFGQMAEISAAGSRIAVTYVTPEGLPHNRLGREIMLRSLDALGEPFLGVVSREAMAEALSSAGFGLLSDENENAWIQRFAMPSKGPTFPSWEWLAVATRRC